MLTQVDMLLPETVILQTPFSVCDSRKAIRSIRAAQEDLGISPRTVEVYRANLMVKTGAQSVAELVRIALSLEF